MSFHSETEGTPSKDEHYYEEDFEEDSESNKQTTPTYSNIRKVPCEIENVMSRSPSLLDSPVKARNYLCKLSTENIELRNRLKNLNSKLNEVLEITKKKVRARSTSTHREKVKSQQVTTMDKQINNYQSEWKKLKNRLDQIQGHDYVTQLKEDIKAKEERLKDLEKNIKLLSVGQVGRGKHLNKLEDCLPEQVKVANELNNESTRLRDIVKDIEDTMEKNHEWYEHWYEKEVELKENYDKLNEIAKHYNVNPQSKTSKLANSQYSILKKTLQKGIKVYENSINQLKFQERDFKMQLDSNTLEIKDLKRNIDKKQDALTKVQEELQDIMTAPSSNHSLDRLMSFAKCKIRSREGSEISTPRYMSSAESRRQNIITEVEESLAESKSYTRGPSEKDIRSRGLSSRDIRNNAKLEIEAKKSTKGLLRKQLQENLPPKPISRELKPKKSEDLEPLKTSISRPKLDLKSILQRDENAKSEEIKSELFKTEVVENSSLDNLQQKPISQNKLLDNPKQVQKSSSQRLEELLGIAKSEISKFKTDMSSVKENESESLIKIERQISDASKVIFKELEPKQSQEISHIFENPSIKNDLLTSKVQKIESNTQDPYTAINRKPSDLAILDTNQSSRTGRNRSHLLQENKTDLDNLMSKRSELDGKEIQLFGNPGLTSKPKATRDRSHLVNNRQEEIEPFATPKDQLSFDIHSRDGSPFQIPSEQTGQTVQSRKSIIKQSKSDRLENLAANAEKQEFFDGLFDNSENQKIDSSKIQSKLKPTSIGFVSSMAETRPSVFTSEPISKIDSAAVFQKNNIKVKNDEQTKVMLQSTKQKPTLDLIEEDLIL